jgi:polar amino acid transport system substrate-binding protein
MKKTVLATVMVIVLCFLFSVGSVSAGPVFDRILEKKVLLVGTSGTQPPMTATTKKGEIIGLDADIAKAMAKALGVKLEFVLMPFGKLLPALAAGKVDMVLSGMTMTPERNRKVAFVGPYYVSGKGLLAMSARFTELQQAKGLNTPEVTVAALKHSTSQEFIETMTPKAKRILTDSYDEAIDLMLQEKVDVVIADYPFCALTAYRFRDKGLFAGKSPLTFEPLGIAIPEDTLLINWAQNFMAHLRGTGRLEKLYQQWFGGGPWIDELP